MRMRSFLKSRVAQSGRWAAICLFCATSSAAILACSSGSSSAQTSSRQGTGELVGHVYNVGGPEHAGRSACSRSRCPTAAAVRVRGNQGVIHVHARRQQAFRVQLAPGRYTISARVGCDRRTVNVTAGAVTHVRIDCEIR
jgi:hypothetical protein